MAGSSTTHLRGGETSGRKVTWFLWPLFALAVLYFSLAPTRIDGETTFRPGRNEYSSRNTELLGARPADAGRQPSSIEEVKSASDDIGRIQLMSPSPPPLIVGPSVGASEQTHAGSRVVWNYTGADLERLVSGGGPLTSDPTVRCPPQTARHPAAVLAARISNSSIEHMPACATAGPMSLRTKADTRDSAHDVLERWGLRPRLQSPLAWPRLTTEDCSAHTSWRGAAVEVMANVSNVVPLAPSYGRRRRSARDIQVRADYHSECINTAGPRGTAHEVSGGTMPVFTPPQGRQPTRQGLYGHGFYVHSVIQEWLAGTAKSLGLQDDDVPSSAFEGQATEYYSGPWVEDYWISTFARPRPVSLTLINGATFVWSEGDSTEVVYSVTDLEKHHRSSVVQVLHPTTGEPLPRDASVLRYVPSSSGGSVSVLFPYDAELFYPWIPLLIPWNKLTWKATSDHRMKRFICELGQLLSSTLAADAQFVTLSQRAAGPWLGSELGCGHTFLQALQNTIVITAGGVGHVPIPLLAQIRPFLECSAEPSVQGHTNDVIFIGNVRKGARAEALRAVQHSGRSTYSSSHEELLKDLLDASPGRGLRASWSLPPEHVPSAGTAVKDIRVDHAVHKVWLRAMAGGTFQLAPRGTGPTSFRLYESLQMGLVPIYIHDGQPWLPYLRRGQSARWREDLPEGEQSLWAQIALVMNVEELRQWLAPLDRKELDRLHDDMASLSRSFFASRIGDGENKALRSFQRMQLAAARVRDRYFSYDGLFRRLAEWLDEPDTAELDCQGSSFLDPDSEP